METYELALLSESSVGKTALQIQLAYESFAGTSCPQARYDVPLTDGLAPAVHFPQSRGLDVVLQTQLTVDDQLCILKFFEISTEVPRNGGWEIHCHAFVLVYSVMQRSSFTQLERYHNEIMRAKQGAPKFILVGNEVDKNLQREVTTEEGRQKARAWGCAFFETSAKTRDGVEEAFTRVVRELRGTVVEEPEAAKEPSCWSKCVIL